MNSAAAAPTIDTASWDELKRYYDHVLNLDKRTYQSTNDIPTPLDCVCEMINTIPADFWTRTQLSILDPCCGNGNFGLALFFALAHHHDTRVVLEEMLVFNDINETRLDNVRRVFCADRYKLQITQCDFIAAAAAPPPVYDLIVANPPYAKFLSTGARASKNHNLVGAFIERSLAQLKPGGYLLFLIPDNWMSLADRNVLIGTLTALQILHLDIHTAKKYFKGVGCSFTWFLLQNRPFSAPITVSGVWKKQLYTSVVPSGRRDYIPLFYNETVYAILQKTLDDPTHARFPIETSSDLHRYTKAALISHEKTGDFKYRLIHTPKQTVYASRPHKFQTGYKVFLSTTDKYTVFVDDCGMTQSIAFLRCSSLEEAHCLRALLEHPLYVFLNNICRWGNFNNIRILQRFPRPADPCGVYESFHITAEEEALIAGGGCAAAASL
jgi:SAM-dependent methyltransferase